MNAEKQKNANIEINIDEQSGLPIYRQIVEQLRNCVAYGILKRGDKFPSIRKLAARLAVNPNTIIHAYRILESEGLLVNRHGIGAFVNQENSAKNEMEKLEILHASIRKMCVDAHHLGVDKSIVDELIKKERNALRSNS